MTKEPAKNQRVGGGPVSDSAKFKQTIAALMQVPKEEVEEIMEAEKKPRSGKKRGRKPTP